MKNQISIKEISKKLKDIFPQVADKYEIISLKSNYSEVKLLSNNKNLRPGNTISGPSMFELADLSFYIAIMASTDLGDKSVTTNVSINFIKKPNIDIRSGTAAELLPIVSSEGKVIDVLIQNSGRDYNSSPTLVVKGHGSGARIVPVVSEGKIIDVIEKGYKLGEKVIRYPKVVIGK